jgi:hypothetical protein
MGGHQALKLLGRVGPPGLALEHFDGSSPGSLLLLQGGRLTAPRRRGATCGRSVLGSGCGQALATCLAC